MKLNYLFSRNEPGPTTGFFLLWYGNILVTALVRECLLLLLYPDDRVSIPLSCVSCLSFVSHSLLTTNIPTRKCVSSHECSSPHISHCVMCQDIFLYLRNKCSSFKFYKVSMDNWQYRVNGKIYLVIYSAFKVQRLKVLFSTVSTSLSIKFKW